MRRALTLRTKERQREKIRTGCDTVDALFKPHGLFKSGIYEIYGDAGSGKTQLVLQILAVNSPSIYISTEGDAPTRRLKQIGKYHVQNIDSVMDKIIVFDINTTLELWETIESNLPKLIKQNKTKVVVIDSIAALFRTGVEFGKGSNEMIDRSVWLFNLAAKMKTISHKLNCCFVITNQVSASFAQKKNVAALGLSWSNCVDTRLRITKEIQYKHEEQENKSTIRRIKIEFSNIYAEKEAKFIIEEKGICDIY